MEIVKDGHLYDISSSELVFTYFEQYLIFKTRMALFVSEKGNWFTLKAEKRMVDGHINIKPRTLEPISRQEAREILEYFGAVKALKKHFNIIER